MKLIGEHIYILSSKNTFENHPVASLILENWIVSRCGCQRYRLSLFMSKNIPKADSFNVLLLLLLIPPHPTHIAKWIEMLEYCWKIIFQEIISSPNIGMFHFLYSFIGDFSWNPKWLLLRRCIINVNSNLPPCQEPVSVHPRILLPEGQWFLHFLSLVIS